MGKKRKGRCAKNNIQAASLEPEYLTRAPHSFVFHRGAVGKYIGKLVNDFRKVMAPFTASNLKIRKKNTLKDIVAVTGPLHVSHLAIFTLTELSPYLRIVKVPRGPTLTFKLHSYILATDVASSLKKQYDHPKMFQNSPLIIMNGFSGESPELKLMISTFQGMFPTINVTNVDLNNVKRCLLINYNAESKLVEIRHYAIRVTPVGLSKGIKKLVSTKVPNLGKFEDISDFIEKGDLLSESEAEDDPNIHVDLPQAIKARGNIMGNKSAIRLTELGPRMTLQLIKVETGLMDGEVMFHEFIQKTEEEKAELIKRREAKRKLKFKRKQKQTENVKKKQLLKEEHKKKSMEGIFRKKMEWKVEKEYGDDSKPEAEKPAEQEDDFDDDAEWYRKEVGEEPEADLFSKPNPSMKRKRDPSHYRPYKKSKPSTGKSIRWKDQEDNKRSDKEGFSSFKRRKGVVSGKEKRKNFKGGKTVHQPHRKKFKQGTKVTRGKRH